ncbi:MAG TPA: isoprenylcysteine carboxylmethyltransferase family protein [Terriglobia bacterium]|nr:isoprenylcysteine carboxylmethyltransferase family protein [Terriglobia bacterium]
MTFISGLWEKILLPLRWIFFSVIFLAASWHPLQFLRDPVSLAVLGLVLIWRTYEHVSIGMKGYRFMKDPGRHTMALPALSLWFGCSFPVFDYYNLPPTLPRSMAFRLAGVGLLVLGMSIRHISIRTLGRYFTAHLRVDQGRRLVREGIYRTLRHPSYFGMIFSFLGLPLAFGSLIGAIFMMCVGVPALVARINLEESFLVDEFKEEYIEYRRSTYKLIPFVY